MSNSTEDPGLDTTRFSIRYRYARYCRWVARHNNTLVRYGLPLATLLLFIVVPAPGVLLALNLAIFMALLLCHLIAMTYAADTARGGEPSPGERWVDRWADATVR